MFFIKVLILNLTSMIIRGDCLKFREVPPIELFCFLNRILRIVNGLPTFKIDFYSN